MHGCLDTAIVKFKLSTIILKRPLKNRWVNKPLQEINRVSNGKHWKYSWVNILRNSKIK